MTSGGGVPYGRGSGCCCPERGVPLYTTSAMPAIETQSHPSLRIVNSFILLSRDRKKKAATIRKS